MSAALEEPEGFRFSPPGRPISELLLAESPASPSAAADGRCWLSILLRPEARFLRGGGTGGGGPREACEYLLMADVARSSGAESLSSSSCSYVAGRSDEGLRTYCELGRREGGGGGGAIFGLLADVGGGLVTSSGSLTVELRDALLRSVSVLLLFCF